MNCDMMINAFNMACKDYGYDAEITILESGKYVFTTGDMTGAGVTFDAGDINKMLECMKTYTLEKGNTDFRDAIRRNMFGV